MRTIWHSLAWKEWHEHKWKLASLVAILWGVATLAIFQDDHYPFGLAAGLVLVCLCPLSLFIGLGAAANERSRGTLSFLQALPAPTWRIAISKLLFGILTVVVPILLTAILFAAWMQIGNAVGIRAEYAFQQLRRGPLSTGVWYLDFILPGAMIAASLFIWAAAAGVNSKDEISAGAFALGTMVGWTTLIALLVSRTSLLGSDSVGQLIAVSTLPGGIAIQDTLLRPRHPEPFATAAIASFLTHLSLAAWYVKRFGRINGVEVRSPQEARSKSARPDWLAPPRRNWLSAIVWKQVRESGPIVVAGLAGVAGIVALFVLPNLSQYDAFNFARVLFATTLYLGFTVTLVLGIGTFLNDLSPQINAFWRSRPINPNSWFWIKLFAGWCVLLLSFALPLVVAGLLLRTESREVLGNWQAVFFVLVPLSIYASAAATTCLLRHAVYAAILSLPLTYIGVLLVWLITQITALADPAGWSWRGLFEMTEVEAAVGLGVGILISSLLAWLAVRNDWGWKSRN